MKRNSFLHYLISAILIVIIVSCTSMDHYYEDYIPLADKIYPGKADSVFVFTGYKRALISTLLSSDPKVTELTIYWHNKQDSVVVPIVISDVGKRKEILISPLEEGTYSFELITFDAEDHSSVTTEGFVRVYGDSYIGSLSNRVIAQFGINSGNVAFIRWIPITSETLIGTKLIYKNQTGENTELIVPKDEETSLLPEYKPGEVIRYRAMFLPEKMAIDTFYTAEKNLIIQ